MRTQKEVQKWLDSHQISKEEIVSLRRWLQSCPEYDAPELVIYGTEFGSTLQDFINFVNSESEETDLSPIIAQFEKIEKEILKLRKLINKL